MPLEIPIQNAPSFVERVRLDGIFYKIGLRWNSRMAAWIFDLYDSSDNPLVLGSPVRVRTPLARFRSIPGTPPGLFMPIDTSNADLDPTLTDLGTRVKIYYFTVLELGR